MQRWAGVARDMAAIGVATLFAFPFLWLATTAFKGDADIYRLDAGLFDFTPTLQNFAVTLTSLAPAAFDSRLAIIDSLLVGLASTLIAMGVGFPAAYALSRLPLRRAGAWLGAAFVFRILPPVALVVPVFIGFREIGLFDTRLGLILAHAAIAAPVAILMLKSFIDEVPREVDEAALIDGATRLQAARLIVLPMARSGALATAAFCFLLSFTEFLVSLFLTSSFRTLPVKLSTVPYGEIGPLAALSLVSLAPAAIGLYLLRRSLVRGFTFGLQR
jgi:multiple sugar transport system permease protein